MVTEMGLSGGGFKRGSEDTAAGKISVGGGGGVVDVQLIKPAATIPHHTEAARQVNTVENSRSTNQ